MKDKVLVTENTERKLKSNISKFKANEQKIQTLSLKDAHIDCPNIAKFTTFTPKNDQICDEKCQFSNPVTQLSIVKSLKLTKGKRYAISSSWWKRW